MRWYISYPILAAGLAFGFDTFFPDAPDNSRSANAEIQSQDQQPTVVLASELDAGPASRVAAFSPGASLAAEEPSSPTTSVLDYLAQTLSPSEPEPAPVALAPVTVSAWKSAVVREKRPGQPAPTTARPEAATRLALARDIQRELQRVGCYLGEIDGVWGGGSKRAVLMFMDRVNASLPTREPDVIMLSLLRGQSEAVCGASCPRGQSLTAAGRCVPSTLMAHADKPGGSGATAGDASGPTVAEAIPEYRPVPYGRMSIGGPKSENVTQFSPGWSPVTGETRGADPTTLARTAALEPTLAEGELTPGSDPAAASATSSFDTDAVPERRSKPSVSRAKSRARPARRSGTVRHVQRLFQHPLGSM